MEKKENSSMNEILGTLTDAENQVARLRELIEGKPTRMQEGQQQMVQPSDAKRASSAISSKDSFSHHKYMTVSNTLLFENQGIEVFRIADSVGLYFIVPNTKVRTAARSAVLRVVRINEEYHDDVHPTAFVQVGEWVYPLIPGSLVYRSEHKYYLFPDLISTTPGTSVGVVLPKSCPIEQREEFEKLVLGFVGMEDFPPHPPPSFGKSTDLILSARTSVSLIRTGSGVYSQRSSKLYQEQQRRQQTGSPGYEKQEEGNYGKRIGSGLKAGGELFAKGLELGAIGTANAISLGATFLTSTFPREENQSGVPNTVVDALAFTKNASGKVVELSAAIMAKLEEMTRNFAALTACYIRGATEPLVTKVVKLSGISSETCCTFASGAKDIGDGIVDGAIEAYLGLHNAARIMADALSANTEDVIVHCYGPSAAEVLHEAAEVVGNVAVSGMAAGQMVNPRRIARQTMTHTGIALFNEECGGS